jgi:hypothetical protein
VQRGSANRSFGTGALHNDEISDRSDQSEIAGERRGHGYDEPRPLRIGRASDEWLQDQNGRDIAEPAKLLGVFVVDTNETELTIPFGS